MENFYNKAIEKWDKLALPLGSLGILQNNISKICSIQKTINPDISRKCVVVFCADNGIINQKVSQADHKVTSIVAYNMCEKKSAMCKMAEIAKSDIFIIDVGMKTPIFHKNLINKSIMKGTNDFFLEKAMSKEQVLEAIEVGEKFVGNNLNYDIFAIGEMGIGNTTTSSAVASIILDEIPENVTDFGAGLSNDGVLHKINIIKYAIFMHKPDKNDIIDVLTKIGGLDICAMIGVVLGCVKHQKVCLLDGFISLVAFICAEKLEKLAPKYVIASHISAYKNSDKILKKYHLEPTISANMRLGEGSGAVAIMPILDMAVKIFNEMPTFEDINIERYKKF